MNFRSFFIAMLAFAVMSMGHPAYGLDQWIDQPEIGKNFDTTHTASKGRIIEVEGTLEADFPVGETCFVIPRDVTIRFEAVRATGDWDTHRHGEECNVVEDPIPDVLKAKWPRWRCNIGQFVPLGGEAANEADLGTTVLWKAPLGESPLPGVWMSLFEDDVQKWDGTDDGGPLGEYGVHQDDVRVRAVEIVSLEIRNEDFLMVTHATPGPNARDFLGLWTREETLSGWLWSWLVQNTMDENDQYLRTDYDGAGVYFGSHPLAVGSCLKTEIVASIAWDEQTLSYGVLPANIVAALPVPANWRVDQDRKGGLYINGVASANPDEYTAGWVPESGTPFGEGHFTFACDFPSGQQRGWLYFGDTPGLAGYTDAIGSPYEDNQFKADLKTGVLFDFNGHQALIHVKNQWGVYVRLVKEADPMGPMGWVVVVPAMPKPAGAW